MKNVIGVVGGRDKIEAILGALHGNFIKVLITDEQTAASIMNLGKVDNVSHSLTLPEK